MTDPVDPFVLLRMKEYKEFTLVNVASDDLALPKTAEEELDVPETDETISEVNTALISLFKETLGEQVADVRTTKRLTESPARL